MVTEPTHEAMQQQAVKDFYHPSFAQLIEWFDGWLNEPLSDREKVLLGETVDYLKTNNVKRFDIERWAETFLKLHDRRQKMQDSNPSPEAMREAERLADNLAGKLLDFVRNEETQSDIQWVMSVKEIIITETTQSLQSAHDEANKNGYRKRYVDGVKAHRIGAVIDVRDEGARQSQDAQKPLWASGSCLASEHSNPPSACDDGTTDAQEPLGAKGDGSRLEHGNAPLPVADALSGMNTEEPKSLHSVAVEMINKDPNFAYEICNAIAPAPSGLIPYPPESAWTASEKICELLGILTAHNQAKIADALLAYAKEQNALAANAAGKKLSDAEELTKGDMSDMLQLLSAMADKYNFEDSENNVYNMVVETVKSAAGKAVPDGWVLVPKEPTDEMAVRAAIEHSTAQKYKTMLAAAPQSPLPTVSEVRRKALEDNESRELLWRLHKTIIECMDSPTLIDAKINCRNLTKAMQHMEGLIDGFFAKNN